MQRTGNLAPGGMKASKPWKVSGKPSYVVASARSQVVRSLEDSSEVQAKAATSSSPNHICLPKILCRFASLDFYKAMRHSVQAKRCLRRRGRRRQAHFERCAQIFRPSRQNLLRVVGAVLCVHRCDEKRMDCCSGILRHRNSHIVAYGIGRSPRLSE